VSTVNAEIMQTASNLHDLVSNTVFGQAEHVLDNPTPFHACNGMFNHNPDARQNVVEQLVADAQLLAFGLFFTWLVSTCAGS
jgi:hypothetical protein